MEAQQGLPQVPRAAGTNKVPEGAIDTLPAALHGEDALTQLPAVVVVNIVILLWKSLGNIIDTQSLKIRIDVHVVLMCIYLANIFDIRK